MWQLTLGKKICMTRFWFDFLKDVIWRFDSVLNTSPYVLKVSVSIVFYLCYFHISYIMSEKIPTVYSDILSVHIVWNSCLSSAYCERTNSLADRYKNTLLSLIKSHSNDTGHSLQYVQTLTWHSDLRHFYSCIFGNLSWIAGKLNL